MDFLRTKDLVALAAFPKSGVTYLSSLLFHCFFPGDVADYRRIETNYIVDIHVTDIGCAAKYRGKSYFKTHFKFGAGPQFDNRTAKAIYLMRHPIDVMNSAFDFRRLLKADDDKCYQEFVDEWISSGGGGFDLAGTWEDHVRSWQEQKKIPVHVVKYGELVDSPKEQLSAIFEFLGVEPNERDIDFAVANSSMAAMRAREEEELAAKQNGVFYNDLVAQGMAQGARFVNKGYRGTLDKLTATQRVAAEERFGPLVRQGL